MAYLLAAALLRLSSIYPNNISVETFDFQDIKNDLTEFNISCTNDNCQSYEEDSLEPLACHCGIHCVELGTCCFDSPYANVPPPERQPACRYLHGGIGYFIVDHCPFIDSAWGSLCNNESIEDDDVKKHIPVTSLLTSVTYKNYYCFRCHETTDEFLYWILKVKSIFTLSNTYEYESKEIFGHICLIYKQDTDIIMAYYGDKIGYMNVLSSLQIPSEIVNITYVCEPDVISDCSDDWADDEVRNKCHSYMALKSIDILGESIVMYKNIHCALCNYENLTDVYCTKTRLYNGTDVNRDDVYGPRFGNRHGVYNDTRGHRFSFVYLLDINRSDGELVGMIKKCSDDHVWDHFTNKCRKLTCALPEYKIKNGKCIKD